MFIEVIFFINRSITAKTEKLFFLQSTTLQTLFCFMNNAIKFSWITTKVFRIKVLQSISASYADVGIHFQKYYAFQSILSI